MKTTLGLSFKIMLFLHHYNQTVGLILPHKTALNDGKPHYYKFLETSCCICELKHMHTNVAGYIQRVGIINQKNFLRV